MNQLRLAHPTFALCTLALTLAACGGQAPTKTTAVTPTAQQDGPPAGATVQEFAATPILPISTLPGTLEKHPKLRELLKKEGKLDGLLRQAAEANNSLAPQATAGTCTPVRWLAELSGKLRVGDSFKCSVPFQSASIFPYAGEMNGSSANGHTLATGDGKRTSLLAEASLPSKPGTLYQVDWGAFVLFPDGSYWSGPPSVGGYYTTVKPGVAPRTPVTPSGQGYHQTEAGGTRAYAHLSWTFPPPTAFLAAGHRVYDVTTNTRTLVAEESGIVSGWQWQPVNSRTVSAGASTPGMRRKYQVCTYNRLEELCSKVLQVKWAGGQAPTATFTSSPAAPLYTGPVSFDASASRDPDGRVVSYHWDFGDSSEADAQSATTTHTYDSPGEYEVKLTVADDSGNKGEFTRTVNVIDPAPTVSTELVTTVDNGVPSYQVSVSWTPAQGMNVTEYRVKREMPYHYDEPPIAILDASKTAYEDTLPADASLWVDYQVCAFDAATTKEVCSEWEGESLPE